MDVIQYWETGLTPELISKAEMELGETPDVRTKCLEELRQLIEGEAGFQPVMDDSFLLRFLRVRKYDTKKAFKTLKHYYYFKSKYSGSLTDFKPSQLKSVLEMNKIFISPKTDSDGGAIYFLIMGTFDVKKASAYDFFATGFLSADIVIDYESFQVCGGSMIFDFRGMSLERLIHFTTPSYLAALVRGVQDCWPYRIKGFHVLQPPTFFGVLYNVIRPMLSKKLRDRIFFHNDGLESLHAYFPPECLPKEFGGQLNDSVYEDFCTLVLSKETYMDTLNKYIYKGKPSPALKEELMKKKCM